MAAYSGGSSLTKATLNATTSRTDIIILAGTNSATVTHNFGYLAKPQGFNGTDINAAVFELLNETVNSFDVALQGGILAADDVHIAVTYV